MEVGSEHPVKRATVRESEESMSIVISIRNRLVVSSLLLTTARNLEVKKGPGRTGSVKGKRFITCLNTLESVIGPAGGKVPRPISSCRPTAKSLDQYLLSHQRRI